MENLADCKYVFPSFRFHSSAVTYRSVSRQETTQETQWADSSSFFGAVTLAGKSAYKLSRVRSFVLPSIIIYHAAPSCLLSTQFEI